MAISERRTAIRLPDADFEAVELLAEWETEGNVSAMLRRLIREALRARGRREPSGQASTAEPF